MRNRTAAISPPVVSSLVGCDDWAVWFRWPMKTFVLGSPHNGTSQVHVIPAVRLDIPVVHLDGAASWTAVKRI
jgi:hypothetical protein